MVIIFTLFYEWMIGTLTAL